MKKIGLFAAGVLFGTAGLKVLGSKDARKVYAQTTAAALRAKDCVMTTVTTVRECADDIYADAVAGDHSNFILHDDSSLQYQFAVTVRGSVMTPVRALAAAVAGLLR